MAAEGDSTGGWVWLIKILEDFFAFFFKFFENNNINELDFCRLNNTLCIESQIVLILFETNSFYFKITSNNKI